MVGYTDFCINMAPIGLPIAGTKNIVDALVDASPAVGEPQSVARGTIAVGEHGGDAVMGIGDR